MAIVILGATGGLGRALSERLARTGKPLVLVARDRAALEGLVAPWRERFPSEIVTIATESATESATGSAAGSAPDHAAETGGETGGETGVPGTGCGPLDRIMAATRSRGGIEALLLPLGYAVRDDLSTSQAEQRRIVEGNFLVVVEAVTRLWPMLQETGGVVVGFGSITGIRGRGRNIVYGAVKRALRNYFESLRLAGDRCGVRVQFWTVGFLATDAMAAKATPLPKADPARFADRVVAGLDGGSRHRVFPVWWRPIALILALAPWWLYARLFAGPANSRD